MNGGQARGRAIISICPCRMDRATISTSMRSSKDSNVSRVRATALIVSLGLDAAKEDPVGTLTISTGGFHRAAERIASLDMPVLLVHEGGYLCDAEPESGCLPLWL